MKLTQPEARVASEILKQIGTLDSDQAERVLAHVQDTFDRTIDDRPMFARGIAGPLGKLVCVVRTKIDEITFGLLLQLCSARRIDVATLLRDCIYAIVHGKTYQQMVLEKINHEAKHTEALAKLIAPFGAPESDGGRHD